MVLVGLNEEHGRNRKPGMCWAISSLYWKHFAAISSTLQLAYKMDAISSSASAQELLWIMQQEAAELLGIGPKSLAPGGISTPHVT